ncbi:hypothetical protein ACFVVQ_12890 [Paenibacillus chitinolyticus]|uniref:hypothetical protein n=1 Tax=Paenibacillus chitinolyticus TaxID=79263 RepID=UPI0036DE89EB
MLNKRAADINRNVIKTGRLLADFQLTIGEEGQANPRPESILTPTVLRGACFSNGRQEKPIKRKTPGILRFEQGLERPDMIKSAVTDRAGSKQTVKIRVLFPVKMQGKQQGKQQGEKGGCHFPIAEICRFEV